MKNTQANKDSTTISEILFVRDKLKKLLPPEYAEQVADFVSNSLHNILEDLKDNLALNNKKRGK